MSSHGVVKLRATCCSITCELSVQLRCYSYHCYYYTTFCGLRLLFFCTKLRKIKSLFLFYLHILEQGSTPLYVVVGALPQRAKSEERGNRLFPSLDTQKEKRRVKCLTHPFPILILSYHLIKNPISSLY